MCGIEWIFFDWGGTLADVAGQANAFHRGATEAGRLFVDGARADGHPAAAGADQEHAGADRSLDGQVVDRLIALVHTAEDMAARDSELREAQLEQVIASWLEEMGVPHDRQRVEQAVDRLGALWVGALDVFAWSAATLDELWRRGYRLGLVSNCMIPPKYALRELERHGLASHLEFKVLSSGLGYRKPSARIYRAALREAFGEVAPEDLTHVLFVGDAPVMDVIGPASMGMKTALVRREPGVWPGADYARARPDYRVNRIDELLEILPQRSR